MAPTWDVPVLFTIEELVQKMKKRAFWSVLTKARHMRNWAEKRRKASKTVKASRSTTEFAISLRFKVLKKKQTGLSP